MSADKILPHFFGRFEGDVFVVETLQCEDDDAGNLASHIGEAMKELVAMRDFRFVDGEASLKVEYVKLRPRGKYFTYRRQMQVASEAQVASALVVLRPIFVELNARLDAYWDRVDAANEVMEAFAGKPVD